MKRVLSAAIVLIAACATAYGQTIGTRTGVAPATNGPNSLQGIWVSSLDASPPAPGQWHTVDVTTKGLPADTLAVDVGGFLVITSSPTTAGTYNLTLALRADGDTSVACDAYIGQAITVNPPTNNGERELQRTMVRLNAGKFQYCWGRGRTGVTPAEWPDGAVPAFPTGAAYIVNIKIQSWILP